jgi:glycosyltransferase involved in cell wall biosynthesis
MKLSVVISVYNEESTIEEIVRRVRAAPTGDLDLEIAISNDCSSEKLKELSKILDGKADVLYGSRFAGDDSHRSTTDTRSETAS